METKLFDDFTKYQEQFFGMQKKFFDTWMDNLPTGKFSVEYSDNLEKTLAFQEEMVDNYLQFQEEAQKMLLETQKKFWKEYFDVLKKPMADTQYSVSVTEAKY